MRKVDYILIGILTGCLVSFCFLIIVVIKKPVVLVEEKIVEVPVRVVEHVSTIRHLNPSNPMRIEVKPAVVSVDLEYQEFQKQLERSTPRERREILANEKMFKADLAQKVVKYE